jgi:hypothetical protein
VSNTRRVAEARRTVLKSMPMAAGSAALHPVFEPLAALAQEASDARVAQILARTISVDLHNHLQIGYARATPLPPGDTPVGGRGRGRGPAGPPPTITRSTVR